MPELVNVAVAGATGAVGEAMCEILEQRNFPMGDLRLLASNRSAGKRIWFRDHYIRVECLEEFDFSGTQIALFSAGGHVSELHAPRAARSGAIVVDNTSHFRTHDDIPLVVPEVNSHRIAAGLKTGIIANPNCSTIQMVVALKPIYDAVGIERINVATYQAVSGAGSRALKELALQTANILNAKEIEPEVAPVQIAFNAIPQIGDFNENGYTQEEMKMVWETQKIFEDPAIKVNPTCVRIPVFFGHSEAVHVETREPIAVEEARQLLREARNVELIDERTNGGYPTAVLHAAGNDAVYVGRIRKDVSHERGLSMWIVSDNVRKGAALNSIQIAEEVVSLIG